MSCENKCCDNSHEYHEHISSKYGINVTALANTQEPLIVEEAAEYVPDKFRKPGTKITFWTFEGWQTWQFCSMDVREWLLPEAWKKEATYGEEEIKDLQNQIDSIQQGGWAISQELGTDQHIGISQKALTELIGFNNIPDTIRGRITGLDNRLGIVEQLAEISIDGGEAQIATAADFDNPTTEQKAKIPTVGAILDGADSVPTEDSDKLVTSGGVKAALDARYTKTEADALLAGKQDTLTFDSTPTQNSTNPVTSGGVYSVINSLKSAGYLFVGVATPSSTISTPTEKVFYLGGAGTYANFGTSVTVPVGSICVFKYNGSWTKEQIALFAGIDDVPTAGSDNLVKSGGVVEEIETISDRVSEVEADIAGESKVNLSLYKGKRFEEDGYRDFITRARTQLLPAGIYSISGVPSNYAYNVYSYVSDNQGTKIYNTRTADLKFDTSSSVIFNFIRTDVGTITDEDISTLTNSVSIKLLSNKSVKSFIENSVTELTYEIAQGQRLSNYFEDVAIGRHYDIKFDSINNYNIENFRVLAYNKTTLIEDLGTVVLGTTKRVLIPENTTRILFFNGSYVNSATTAVIKISPSENVINNTARIEAVENTIYIKPSNAVFCRDVSSYVLVEMYFPNITSDWKIIGVTATNDMFRLNLKDGNGTSYFYGEGGTAEGQSLKGKYSDLIHTWVNKDTCEVIGYFIIHYTGTNYAVSSPTGYTINVSAITSLDCNPRIKEYLSRKENLVLIGDSMFGKGECNILSAMLRSNTNKRVFNGGMGGMRMSIRGNTNADALSYVGISDAIYNEDWTDVQAAAIATGGATNPYQIRLAELKAVDWSKPTTVIACYCNNDITGNVAIGDMWTFTSQKSDFVKTTLLGAMNYGIYNILGKYPLVRLVHTTLGWRYKTDKNNNVVPPYAYLNTNDNSDADYNEAIKGNALRLGISVFDFSAYGGRNEFNRDTENGIFFDGSHFNVLGYEKCAEMIKAIDKGWIM